MRILVGSLQQETNSFSPCISTTQDFYFERGKAMLDKIASTQLFVDAGAQLIPSVYAHAVPSGQLQRRDFLQISEEILSAARNAPDLDGVWLYLHGALDVEGIGSGELHLLHALRDIIGYTIPIAVTLDFLLLYGKGNPVDALDVFGSYVRGIHGKDGCYPTDGRNLGKEMPIGQGRVNYPALIEKLKEIGYDGAITIEREISGEQQLHDILLAKEIFERYI